MWFLFASLTQFLDRNLYRDVSGDVNTRVTCTACFQQVILHKPGTAWRHPLLRVLLCKVRYLFMLLQSQHKRCRDMWCPCYLESVGVSVNAMDDFPCWLQCFVLPLVHWCYLLPYLSSPSRIRRAPISWPEVVRGNQTWAYWFTAIIFVVAVCLSVCLCRVFLSRLWSDFDQTWTYVICLGLVVSPRI